MNIVTLKKQLLTVWLVLAVLWTLAMGAAYALLELTDVLVQVINGFLSAHPDVARWLTAAAGSAEQWGGWVLLIVWALGLLLLGALGWVARRVIALFPEIRLVG
jgi:hypothetical protein